MCSITGFLDKTGNPTTSIGSILLKMLTAVSCRGPDSTGVAAYGPIGDGFRLQVKLGESGDFSERAADLLAVVKQIATVCDAQVIASYLRLVVNLAPDRLVDAIEAMAPEVEVVSLGRKMEIVKRVGSPQDLEDTYSISRWVGTHGIGHTRLSTESRIDLSHSQPFWAHGMPDVASAHNGHITNYHKMRRIYAQRGYRFYTENDSEIIGIYLRDRMIEQGDSFEEALRASFTDFDGSYCYLASSENSLAYVKDPYGFKPLVIAETDEWAAVATEEIALRRALGGDFCVREPGTRSMKVWNLKGSG